MTELFLTRHGETVWNTEKRFQGWHNSPLTEKGNMQAEILRKVVTENSVDIIYTSPLERAYRTALSAIGDTGIPLRVLPELRELYLGEWEGKTYEELERDDNENFINYWTVPEKYIPRGGESYRDLTERSRKAIDIMLNENSGKRILAVTHGMTLMALIHILTEKPLSEILKEEVLPQTSVTHIRINDKDNKIKNEMIVRGCTKHFRTED